MTNKTTQEDVSVTIRLKSLNKVFFFKRREQWTFLKISTILYLLMIVAVADKNLNVNTNSIRESIPPHHPYDPNLSRVIVKLKTFFVRRRCYTIQNDTQVIMDLPKQEAIVVLISQLDIKNWEKEEDVEFVEIDPLRHINSEIIPYGVDMIEASRLDDSKISNQKVCVIDSGYDLGHEDLPKLPIVTGKSDALSDTCGHGTHVSGIIAAVGNNNIGTMGVSGTGTLQLHVVRVLDGNCNWTHASGIIASLNECAQNGAKVVNISLGDDEPSLLEQRVFAEAYKEGMLIVGSTGNSGSNRHNFPASYDSVISVGAVDEHMKLYPKSQKNSQVEFVAPGVNVLSTLPGNRYGYDSGTSMAASYCTGAIALLWSHFPEMNAAGIRHALQMTAEDIALPGRDNVSGYGIIKLAKAYEFLSTKENNSSVTSELESGWYDFDGWQVVGSIDNPRYIDCDDFVYFEGWIWYNKKDEWTWTDSWIKPAAFGGISVYAW
eukprot:CAMPEP_0113300232 /NCGR_PEP_ID=MMETSP0010_2-20120614/1950_1 /TAXON_ID=216773 ORGANISM="Corethron hystrix, Strain 308" /NCGR_SAMPLE_ID=MMETSP0010_2 /ASSEMBLY_ACC=CAM_ASM_000155 /LENGTH=489 /DNA_ID=CAMNT_0000153627 /DNA_START=271 /DNA_END=1737 /DNA_ORIENTATION=- /assembly_acc=CAM_ASM_000155